MLSTTAIESLVNTLEEKLSNDTSAQVQLPTLPAPEDFEKVAKKLPPIVCAQLYYVLSHQNQLAHIDQYRIILNAKLKIDPKLVHGSLDHIEVFNFPTIQRIASLELPDASMGIHLPPTAHGRYVSPLSLTFNGDGYRESRDVSLGLLTRVKKIMVAYLAFSSFKPAMQSGAEQKVLKFLYQNMSEEKRQLTIQYCQEINNDNTKHFLQMIGSVSGSSRVSFQPPAASTSVNADQRLSNH